MNTIVVKNENLSLENCKVNLEIKVKKLELTIDKEVCINDLITTDTLELIIHMKENARLLYNKRSINTSYFKVTIDSKNNNYVELNYSLEQSIPCTLVIDTKVEGINSNVSVNVHGVTKELGSIHATAEGIVKENVKNTELLENIRIIALNDTDNFVIPNLLVSTNDARVNHNATISGIPKDYLFYLESKGLSYNACETLIVDGFLKKNLKGVNENE